MKRRMIKSGTSNYWKGNSEYGFPLVIYEAENYVYDEETDSNTDERDYVADQWEYEDAIENAGILADKYGIEVNPGESKDYPTGPFVVRMRDGYYTGLQIQVDDYEPDGMLIAEDEEEYERLSEDYPYDYVYRRSELEAEAEKWYEKIMAWMKELCQKQGWEAISVLGHFSNGEGVYEKSGIFDSRRVKRGARRLRSGYSNNSDYFGDWFDKGQIDFSKIINPDDPGDVYMVKMWSGSGYVLDVYLCRASNEYDAIDRVFEWSYENEGKNNLVFDYDYILKEAREWYRDDPDYFGKGMDEEYFIDRWIEENYVSNDDYDLFARAENFFVGKVPEKYLRNSRRSLRRGRRIR